MSRLGWVFLTLVLLVVVSGVQAVDYEASRIELKNGDVYNNVTFSYDDTYKVIRIDLGNARRAVSFSDVSLILDKDGNDVTVDVLGKYYNSDQTAGSDTQSSDSWTGQTSPHEKSSAKQAKPWVVRLALHPDFTIPAGDYYTGLSAGIGYGAEMSIRLSRELALRGMVSRATFSADDMAGVQMWDVVVIEDNTGYHAWRYSIALEYHNWPGYRMGGKLLYYAYSGLGAISHTVSGTMLVYNTFSDEYYQLTLNDTQTKFMMNSGAGLTVALSRNIGINFGGDLYMSLIGGSGYQTQTAYNIDFKAGLVILFQ